VEEPQKETENSKGYLSVTTPKITSVKLGRDWDCVALSFSDQFTESLLVFERNACLSKKRLRQKVLIF